MINHEEHKYQQCVVTFGNDDVYAATGSIEDVVDKKGYGLLMFSNRKMEDGFVDVDTVPCVLRFQKPKDVENIIGVLTGLKNSIEKQKSLDAGSMTDKEWEKHLSELKCQSE